MFSIRCLARSLQAVLYANACHNKPFQPERIASKSCQQVQWNNEDFCVKKLDSCMQKGSIQPLPPWWESNRHVLETQRCLGNRKFQLEGVCILCVKKVAHSGQTLPRQQGGQFHLNLDPRRRKDLRNPELEPDFQTML